LSSEFCVSEIGANNGIFACDEKISRAAHESREIPPVLAVAYEQTVEFLFFKTLAQFLNPIRKSVIAQL